MAKKRRDLEQLPDEQVRRFMEGVKQDQEEADRMTQADRDLQKELDQFIESSQK